MRSQTLPAAGCQSRHNLKYWRRHPYLGFGLDAHSMLRTPQGSALRFSNTAVLAEYLRGPEAAEEVRRLSPSEELEEAWFLGLRLQEGVAWQALAAEFGRDPGGDLPPRGPRAGRSRVCSPMKRAWCVLPLAECSFPTKSLPASSE